MGGLCRFGPREGTSEAVFPEFRDEVFKPLVEERVQELLSRYGSPAADYANGGKFEREGYSAAKTAVVIPIALMFSLLGGVAHIIKCTVILASFASSWLMRILAPCAVALTFAVLLARPVQLAGDGFVEAMRHAMQSKYGVVAVALADGAMKLEQAVYPVAKALPWKVLPKPQAAKLHPMNVSRFTKFGGFGGFPVPPRRVNMAT